MVRGASQGLNSHDWKKFVRDTDALNVLRFTRAREIHT
jgi:hypothetical protein